MILCFVKLPLLTSTIFRVLVMAIPLTSNLIFPLSMILFFQSNDFSRYTLELWTSSHFQRSISVADLFTSFNSMIRWKCFSPTTRIFRMQRERLPLSFSLSLVRYVSANRLANIQRTYIFWLKFLRFCSARMCFMCMQLFSAKSRKKKCSYEQCVTSETNTNARVNTTYFQCGS